MHDELNMTMRDALDDLDKNHETESDKLNVRMGWAGQES